MTLRSVYTIDVNDEKFKRFKEAFDKYQEQLAKMPESWRAATAEQDVMLQGVRKAADALVAYDDVSGKLAQEMEAQDRHLTKQSASWRSIARDSKEASGNLSTMTRSFLKWSGLSGVLSGAGRVLTGIAGGTILTGVLGGAAAYGMKMIAETVGDYRRSALGLGTSIGQERAFGLDLGRFITPQQFLGAAAQGIYDFRSPAYRGLVSAGVSPQLIASGNATQVSQALLGRLPGMFAGRAFGTWQSILDATGLGSFLSPEDVRRILSHPQEFQNLLGASGKDQGPLGIADRTAKTWQDMNRQVELAEGSILTTFVKGAEPVAKSFGTLAVSATNAAAALSGLTGAITGKNFGAGATLAGAGTGALLGGRVAGLPGAVIGGVIGATLPNMASGGNPQSAANAAWLAQQRAQGKATWYGQLWDILTQNKPLVPSGAPLTGKAMTDLLALVRQDETRGRSGMEHAVSSAGAIGLYQIMPTTALTYGRDPNRLQDVKYNTETARIILAALVKRYHGNLDQVLAAYHSGPGAADTMRLGPAGREYIEYAHKQNNFRQVQIEVSKSAGADVNVSVQQMPTWLNSALAFSPGN